MDARTEALGAIVRFYIGIHMVAQAHRFERCMISANVLRRRRSDFRVNEWMLDSGAFTAVAKHGGFVEGPEIYAAQIDRWSRCGNLVAAVSQDYMCEPFVLHRTGLTIEDHQRLTIERYDAIRSLVTSGTYVLPVLQGYTPDSYVAHVAAYGDRLADGAWVGVGSICKRNGSPDAIYEVLAGIKRVRPDLRLHGFGVKVTSLQHPGVRMLLETSDSMAWSFAERRREGGDANGWRPALEYAERIDRICADDREWYRQGALL